MKFYIETYGCTANFGNSADATRLLMERGHVLSSLNEADAVIVNTCAVTRKTETKILKRLCQLQGKRLIIAGCLSSALPESIAGVICREQVGVLNISAAKHVSDTFSDSTSTYSTNPSESHYRTGHILPQDSQHLCGIINIAEGCNGGCSYCIVKKARGSLKSQKADDIAGRVRELVGSGIMEIQITAQDTAAYGQDIGTSLPKLLEKLIEVQGDFCLRLGMMNPDCIIPIQKDLIQVLRSHKIYKFLHMPVQSGSNGILKEMGRRYTAEDVLGIAHAFRAAYHEITLITDVIAGFPGETDADHNKTMQLIRQLQPDKVNVTRFSSRPGTEAARLYDMPDRIKKDRSRELTSLWLDIAARRNRRFEGKTIGALVLERGYEGTMKARSANYAGIVVHGAPHLGSFCQIRIVGSNPFYLGGILQL